MNLQRFASLPEQRAASADAVWNKKRKRKKDKRGGHMRQSETTANVAIGHADVHFDASLVREDQCRRSEGLVAQPEAGGAVTHLTSAAGFSAAATSKRGVQGFPGLQESPTFCRVVGKAGWPRFAHNRVAQNQLPRQQSWWNQPDWRHIY